MNSRPENAPAIDREQFLTKSNALLRRMEISSALIVVIGSLSMLIFSRPYSLSLLLGGLLGMGHFRSLHRMFQKRMLDPSAKHKTHFFYGLKLFFMVGCYFWAVQWDLIRSWGVIAGFFLMSASVLLGPRRR